MWRLCRFMRTNASLRCRNRHLGEENWTKSNNYALLLSRFGSLRLCSAFGGSGFLVNFTLWHIVEHLRFAAVLTFAGWENEGASGDGDENKGLFHFGVTVSRRMDRSRSHRCGNLQPGSGGSAASLRGKLETLGDFSRHFFGTDQTQPRGVSHDVARAKTIVGPRVQSISQLLLPQS